MWLWCSLTGAPPADVDRMWQAFLRRFDLEHTFRMFGQVLGWTAPKLRDPAAADRWTWLMCATRRWCAVRRWESKEVRDLLARLSQQPGRSWAQPDPGDAGEGGKQR